jgi:hypothetical protein
MHDQLEMMSTPTAPADPNGHHHNRHHNHHPYASSSSADLWSPGQPRTFKLKRSKNALSATITDMDHESSMLSSPSTKNHNQRKHNVAFGSTISATAVTPNDQRNGYVDARLLVQDLLLLW